MNVDKENTMEGKGYGQFQCYCQKYSSIIDATNEEHECYEYQYDQAFAQFVKQCITIGIVTLNVVLKTINTSLINNIGFPYQSEVISNIVVAVFVSQFINTSLILPLASANLGNTPLRLLTSIVNN